MGFNLSIARKTEAPLSSTAPVQVTQAYPRSTAAIQGGVALDTERQGPLCTRMLCVGIYNTCVHRMGTSTREGVGNNLMHRLIWERKQQAPRQAQVRFPEAGCADSRLGRGCT